MRLKEKQIEDVFEVYYKELLSSDFELVERQYVFENKRRADLLFIDKNKRKVIVELKRDAVTREDIGQLIEYRGILDNENPRIILAAPIIPSTIKKSFEHFGIEYLEFDLRKIAELYHFLTEKSKHKIKVEINEVVSEPLSNKKILDGNVAFKVTYNDKNWSGICSPNIADFNFANRTWCKMQSRLDKNCQNFSQSEFDNGYFPCMDSVALLNLSFYAGTFHGVKRNNDPIRAINVKLGKLALFTSREPGSPERQRFIFAIGQINKITEENLGSTVPNEVFHCDKETALIFNSNFRPKFWNYYRNANTDLEKWNTGLVRYVSDNQILNLLDDLLVDKRLTKRQREKVLNLLRIYE
jgi:hypothetical protein